jgi:hypothetical protein
MVDRCAPKVRFNIDTSEYRESLKRDLDVLYASFDLTSYLNVSSLRPFEDPPEIDHA